MKLTLGPVMALTACANSKNLKKLPLMLHSQLIEWQSIITTQTLSSAIRRSLLNFRQSKHLTPDTISDLKKMREIEIYQ